LVGAALVFLAIGNADAQTAPSPVTLIWNAPAGCSDSAEILKRVADLRGGTTASAEQMSAVANVTLDNASGVWNLQITTNFADGTHGERKIQAESCKAAADATASILALALTARATEVAASSTPPTATATSDLDASAPIADSDAGSRPTQIPPPPPPEEKKPGEPPPAPANPARVHPYVAGFFGGTVGDLPTIGFGGGGALGLSYRAIRVEALVDYYAFSRAHFADTGEANFQTFSVGARSCLAVIDTLSLGPCLDFQLASLAGESFNVSNPSSGTALVPEAFVGAMGSLPLDKNRHFALRALLEIGVPFSRPEFVLDGDGFVHQPAPIIGRGTIGAELRF
jgi:hypothetical protein